jgi:transposase
MTTYCGVDFHAQSQTVRHSCDGDGEIHPVVLDHTRDDVRAFYASLPRPVIVGIEAHGYTAWFEALLAELGHEVWIGDPARIRSHKTRKQKTDDRDAELILDLMRTGRFPRIYRPSPESRQVLQLLRFRHNLVRTRTRAANSLVAIALSCGLRRRPRVLTRSGREAVARLTMSEPLAWQRDEWFSLIDRLDPLIADVERRLEAAARNDERVRRVQTHPGVGLLTGLALVHVLGQVRRFRTSRQVTAYVGLDPVETSSGTRRRMGSISKQGSKLLRFLLVEAGQIAAREDAHLKAVYERIAWRRNKPTAKAAIARRVLVRSWVMLRDEIDYAEFCRRGRQRRGVGPGLPDEDTRLSMPDL